MNWLPVLAAIAIVFAAFFGIDNPSRTIILQLFIGIVALIGLGIEWWKDSRPSSTHTLRMR